LFSTKIGSVASAIILPSSWDNFMLFSDYQIFVAKKAGGAPAASG
jgi:hypothetical protein